MVAEKYPAGFNPGTGLPTNSSDDMNLTPVTRRTAQVLSHITPATQIKGLSARGIAEIAARKPPTIRAMSGTSTPMTGTSTPVATDDGKRKLKILMLHGT